MGFQVSPGVEVKEIDLTNVIPAVSTSIGGYAGYFRWGPVNEIGLVSSEKDLSSKFGEPDAAHSQSFLTAASFLKYGNALKVVRAGDSTAMANSFGGQHEVATGGIETIDVVSSPTEFITSIDGTEALTIVETGEGANGSGAVIVPLYDALNATVNNSFELTGINPSTLSAGTYTITVAGQSVTFTTDGSAVTSAIPAIYGLTDFSGNISVADIDSPSVDVAITITATAKVFQSYAAGDSPALDLLEGQVLTVHTTNGDTSSQSFTVTVTNTSGTPSYTFTAGVATVNAFTAFPASTTGLQAFDDAGAAIPGLFFDATYKIAAIGIDNPGLNYTVANANVHLDGTLVTRTNFSFDEDQKFLGTATFIGNETEFDGVYPPVGEALPGKMFARYPGALGDNIGVYYLDAASWDNNGGAPWTVANPEPGYQQSFDAAPEGDDVHILVYDATGDLTGTQGTVLETWAFLSKTEGARLDDGSNNNYKEVINANSDWIYIARDLVFASTPAGVTAETFSGGLDAPTPSSVGADNADDIINALVEFEDVETVDVNLLFAQVDSTDASPVASRLQTIASNRKDCVAFISPKLSASTGNDALNDVKTYINGAISSRGIEGSYLMFDSTALYVYNKYADNYMYIPACGHMAGLCAKTDGIAEPWFSPAGYNRGGLLGITKLAFNPKKAERDELYKAGINPIVSFPGQGILLFGDKTGQAKPSAFDRINVRRLFIVLEKAIATAAKYQLFELNDEFTRAMFRNMTEPFLRDVKGRRGITDFLVVCDETNNTGEVIDTNRFVADIYIKPARSINFITLNFIATRTGVEFSEIVGK